MSKIMVENTTGKKEKAFLVSVTLRNSDQLFSVEDSLLELERLAQTAGLEIVGQLSQQINKPNPMTFMGSGKVDELKALVEETMSDIIIFDDELNPRHQRELNRIMGQNVRIIDRTSLILDIFAQHAKTKEGMLQVELAQYQYYLPRLTGAWTHLTRQSGGGGGRSGGVGGVGLRGPGETQLELDRRSIGKKIRYLNFEIDKIKKHRNLHRINRKKNNLPNIILIGYTNSGKSTILNKLTNSNVYAADQLFATLDPTTRKLELPGGYISLLTDTVGFIEKLPTSLVAAFRATLEEIADADLLLNIVDISHPNAHDHERSVQKTLEKLDSSNIPSITVLNKIDKLTDNSIMNITDGFSEPCIGISAVSGKGIPELLSLIRNILFETMVPIKVSLPYDQGYLISLFHESGQIEQILNERKFTTIIGRIPGRLVAQFQKWNENEVDGDSVDVINY